MEELELSNRSAKSQMPLRSICRASLKPGCCSFRNTGLFALPDFQNARGPNRRAIRRMTKLQMHAASDKTYLQHRSAPGGSFNSYQHGLGTKCRMAPNPSL